MRFETCGPANTEATLKAALETAESRNIKHVIVATTVGDTGAAAAKLFQGKGVEVVVVTHNAGFSKPGEWQLDPALKREIESHGAKIHCGTMVLRGLGTAIRQSCGNYSEEQIIAATLRMFGQGIKVCVEIAAMAADAGLVPPGDVVCVAGTGRGADTCAVVAADSSNRFFNIKVRDIVAAPATF